MWKEIPKVNWNSICRDCRDRYETKYWTEINFIHFHFLSNDKLFDNNRLGLSCVVKTEGRRHCHESNTVLTQQNPTSKLMKEVHQHIIKIVKSATLRWKSRKKKLSNERVCNRKADMLHLMINDTSHWIIFQTHLKTYAYTRRENVVMLFLSAFFSIH